MARAALWVPPPLMRRSSRRPLREAKAAALHLHRRAVVLQVRRERLTLGGHAWDARAIVVGPDGRKGVVGQAGLRPGSFLLGVIAHALHSASRTLRRNHIWRRSRGPATAELVVPGTGSSYGAGYTRRAWSHGSAASPNGSDRAWMSESRSRAVAAAFWTSLSATRPDAANRSNSSWSTIAACPSGLRNRSSSRSTKDQVSPSRVGGVRDIDGEVGLRGEPEGRQPPVAFCRSAIRRRAAEVPCGRLVAERNSHAATQARCRGDRCPGARPTS